MKILVLFCATRKSFSLALGTAVVSPRKCRLPPYLNAGTSISVGDFEFRVPRSPSGAHFRSWSSRPEHAGSPGYTVTSERRRKLGRNWSAGVPRQDAVNAATLTHIPKTITGPIIFHGYEWTNDAVEARGTIFEHADCTLCTPSYCRFFILFSPATFSCRKSISQNIKNKFVNYIIFFSNCYWYLPQNYERITFFFRFLNREI